MNSDLGNGSFWVKVRDAKHVDRCSLRSTCTQVWLHQLTSDLKRCLLIWKCLQMVVSESSFRSYVCHRRHAGLHALRASCYTGLTKLFVRRGRCWKCPRLKFEQEHCQTQWSEMAKTPGRRRHSQCDVIASERQVLEAAECPWFRLHALGLLWKLSFEVISADHKHFKSVSVAWPCKIAGRHQLSLISVSKPRACACSLRWFGGLIHGMGLYMGGLILRH